MSYYSEHAEEYITSTFNADMRKTYRMFESYLPEGASILDVGFGSARDMLHFHEKGYKVRGIDIEPAFVDHAKKLGLEAEAASLLDYQTDERFDGIWACASLLHLEAPQLKEAIKRLLSLLKETGVLFISMKEGQGEQTDEKGRQMLFVSEKTFSSFNVVELKRNTENGREITWLNAILRP